LINKADFLSPELREHWNNYFNEKGIRHVFFSAKLEQDRIDEARRQALNVLKDVHECEEDESGDSENSEEVKDSEEMKDEG
jgi:large subunit GTPase 1